MHNQKDAFMYKIFFVRFSFWGPSGRKAKFNHNFKNIELTVPTWPQLQENSLQLDIQEIENHVAEPCRVRILGDKIN